MIHAHTRADGVANPDGCVAGPGGPVVAFHEQI